MINEKMLMFWIFLVFLSFTNCQEVPKEFVRRNERYYLAESNEEIPDALKDAVELNKNGLFITGSSDNDTSVLITTTGKNEIKLTFCRDVSLQCTKKEQEFSVCYHNDDRVESINNFDKECNGPRMCKIKVKLSKNENFIFSRGFGENGNSVTSQNNCFLIQLFTPNGEDFGKIRLMSNITDERGYTSEACKLRNIKLPRNTEKFQTEFIVRQGKNNNGCNIKMSPYNSHLIVKGKLQLSTSIPTTKHPISLTTTEKVSAVAQFFDDWKYLIIVIVAIIIIAIIAAIVIKWKWLKKQFQKTKKKNGNSTTQIRASEQAAAAAFDETTPYTSNRQKQNIIAAAEKEKQLPNKSQNNNNNEKKKEETTKKISLKDVKPQIGALATTTSGAAPATTSATVETKPLQVHSTVAIGSNVAAAANAPPSISSTQASLSCNKTPPKSQAEMTPDELEYLAFSTPDTGKRYRIFRNAVKLAEKIAESHGFWVNDRDPTVPGDEEDWLKKHADNLTKICIEIHGVPVPDIGATHNEHLEYIDTHSLRDIYVVALYTEVEEPTRMFFLSSVIERFRDVIKQISINELSKGPHPLPLLYRVYHQHPEVFGLKPPPKKNNNNEKQKNTKKQ